MNKTAGRYGATLTELALVIGLITLLSGLATVSLFNVYKKNSLAVSVDALAADIKSQQLRAMVADTEGAAAAPAYGVYFAADRYILFRGAAYVPGDPANFSVQLNDGLNFTNILFPDAAIVFAPLSGAFSSFAGGADAVTLQDTGGGEQKTIKINRFGVIDGIY